MALRLPWSLIRRGLWDGVTLTKQTWLLCLPFGLGGLTLDFAFDLTLCWKAECA